MMDELTVRPIGNRILVRSVNIERITPGGIVKPVAIAGDSAVAQVVAIGDAVDITGSIKIGDIVHYNHMSGQAVITNKEAFWAVSVDAVVAIELPESVKIMTDEEVSAGERRVKTVN